MGGARSRRREVTMGKEREGCRRVAQKVKGRKVHGFFKVKCLERNLEKLHPIDSNFFVFWSSKRYLRHFLHFLYWDRADSFSFILD